jgi:hypothetical protein
LKKSFNEIQSEKEELNEYGYPINKESDKKTTRNGSWNMGWIYFNFHWDNFGNSKTCRNNMTPFHYTSQSQIPTHIVSQTD